MDKKGCYYKMTEEEKQQLLNEVKKFNSKD
jgi:hypothetical protein